ncbi:MAG TPA: SDR family oxidoreductase [Candidatus Acidoferrales bacterium]|nr:SDR family oxidoreductase [Candidatus Acidoferrales bacterium]
MDLVIGGSGFIGSRLVQKMVNRGRKVRVYDLNPFPAEFPGPSEFVQGDILDLQKLVRATEGCDRVFHLAGIPHLWARQPGMFDRVNHQGTANVLEAARLAEVSRLIYTGTESILTSPNYRGPIDEDVEPLLDDMVGPYCRSKLLAERLVFRAVVNGLNAVIVCPTLPIGPGDRNLTPPGRLISAFLSGKLIAYLDCTLNVVDVRDVALGHLLAAEKGRVGRRYILGGYNLTLLEFCQQLSRISGKALPRFQIPYGVALAWSYLEEFVGKLTGRVPLSSVTGVKLSRRTFIFDGAKSWEELGYVPRPLEETIRDAVAWFQKDNA